MREIKFRAWNGADWLCLDEWPVTDMNIEGFTFEQFTGLHDKNGKEIYEGDIIDRWIDDEKAKSPVVLITAMFWGENTIQAILKKQNTKFSEILGGEEVEIIGNIHENPELIHR